MKSYIISNLSFLFLIIGFTACSNDDDNLIYTANRWFAAVDNFGSDFTTDGALINNGVVSVNFTIARQTDPDSWSPWVALICNLGHNLTDYEGLSIRYKSDKDLIIHLYQSDFGVYGNETYTHYKYRLPPARFWRTRTFKFTEIVQPEWTPVHSKIIPFKPENVTSIYLVPDLDPEKGESSDLEISTLRLF